jgi:hypothetical protein
MNWRSSKTWKLRPKGGFDEGLKKNPLDLSMGRSQRLNELDHPRFFSTEHHIELLRENKQEHYVPVGIEIEGYTVTSFYDKVVKISLE